MSGVHRARSCCVQPARRGRVSSASSAILVNATLVPCLPSVHCVTYKNVNGAVMSMSVEVVANKAVLIMGPNAAMAVTEVTATTAKTTTSNSVSSVMNIIVRTTTAMTACIDHKLTYAGSV
mmetsp:Transcript_4371/g.7208  ORF Transcript_4371/g.7208 Transcript_4371/m.7208 type:complete len:121 (+) Transcript_4371:29-391(+)